MGNDDFMFSESEFAAFVGKSHAWLAVNGGLVVHRHSSLLDARRNIVVKMYLPGCRPIVSRPAANESHNDKAVTLRA